MKNESVDILHRIILTFALFNAGISLQKDAIQAASLSYGSAEGVQLQGDKNLCELTSASHTHCLSVCLIIVIIMYLSSAMMLLLFPYHARKRELGLVATRPRLETRQVNLTGRKQGGWVAVG